MMDKRYMAILLAGIILAFAGEIMLFEYNGNIPSTLYSKSQAGTITWEQIKEQNPNATDISDMIGLPTQEAEVVNLSGVFFVSGIAIMLYGIWKIERPVVLNGSR